MRFFLKLIGLTMILVSTGVGGAVGQRYWRQTPVEAILYTNDQCGQDCWFGVSLDGGMRWPEVQSSLEASGATDMRFRGALMRFRLLNQDANHDGHIQVTVNDTGYAIQNCFFPADFESADLITTWGAPNHFYLDTFTRRAIFDRFNTTTLAYQMRYYFIYTESRIVASGVVYIGADGGVRATFPLNAKIEYMCTPGYDETDSVSRLPIWKGFLRDIDSYTAIGPQSLAGDDLR